MADRPDRSGPAVLTASRAPGMTTALQGVVCVVVAPYRDRTGPFDEDRCSRLVERIVAAGIPAVTALGNTAEVFQLSASERRAHLRSVAAGSGPALGLAGLAGSLGEVVAGAEFAADLGYAAAMLHEPSDPLTDTVGIQAYWDAVLDRIPIPAVLYARSGRVSRETLETLAVRPEVVGVKYAGAEIRLLRELVDAGSDCVWINGAAESRVSQTAGLGVRGFTSGLANVRPDIALAIHAAALAGDEHRLERLLGMVRPFEALRNSDGGRRNVSVVKQALRWSGFDVGDVRPPAIAADPHAVEAIMQAMPAPDELHEDVRAGR